MEEQQPRARPHQRFTDDGRRMREVLSYSRRGSRFTPTQREAWEAHAERWVIPDEAVDEPGFGLADVVRSRCAADRRDRARRGRGDGCPRGGPPRPRRTRPRGLATRRRGGPGGGGRRRRRERPVLLGRRGLDARARHRARDARRAVDVLPRPVAQEEAPQASAGEPAVRRARRQQAGSRGVLAAGHRLGRLRRADARGPRRGAGARRRGRAALGGTARDQVRAQGRRRGSRRSRTWPYPARVDRGA